MTDATLLFRNAIQDAYGLLDWLPIPDGQIHRFHVPKDKAGTLNGWYVLHLDGIASGAFGSWKTGASSTWNSRKPTDHLEAQVTAQRIEQTRLHREAERYLRQQTASIAAVRMWSNAAPADPQHPYIIAKHCLPHGLRQSGEVLLVPLYLERNLVNLQRIAADGSKRFLPGGRVKGCYSPIGTMGPYQPLYICEGWATGATIHEAKGAAVACAMTAGNLLDVGRQLQRQYPDGELVIAGDDDRQTEGNPGRTAATCTASALGCGLIFPLWSGAEPLSLSDFSDLRHWRETNQ